MYVRDSLSFGAPEMGATRGDDLVRDESMQLPPLRLNHHGRETMRKLLLTTAAAIMLAGPALAQNKMVTGTLSGSIKVGPQGPSTIVNALGVSFIAIGNRVDALNVAGNVLLPTCTVTVPLGTIIDMVFTPPSFVTVQGGGPFAVTLDYTTCPPTQSAPTPL